MKTYFQKTALTLGAALLFSPWAAPVQAQESTLPLGGESVRRPLVLQQKWTPGQQLEYDVSMDGTANLQLPADMKALGILAGLPLEVDLRLNGQTTLDTLAVDDFGTGLIAMRVGQLNVKGQAFGQRGELNLTNGRGQLKVNGQAVGDEINWETLDKPKQAFLISRRGHLEGFAQATKSAPQPATPEPQTDVGAENKNPLNTMAMVQAAVLRALPALWPTGAISKGDTWSDEIGRATLPTGNTLDAAANNPAPGRVQFTLLGEEEVAGRKTQRVAVAGKVNFDKEDLNGAIANLSEKDRAGAADNMKWLDKAGQDFNGDVWFDPTLGQVVRVEMTLNAQMQNRVAQATGTDKTKAGWSQFTGLLQMQLKKVTQDGVSFSPRGPEF